MAGRRKLGLAYLVSEALCVGSTDCSIVETTWCGSQTERCWGYSFKLFMYLCIILGCL